MTGFPWVLIRNRVTVSIESRDSYGSHIKKTPGTAESIRCLSVCLNMLRSAEDGFRDDASAYQIAVCVIEHGGLSGRC